MKPFNRPSSTLLAIAAIAISSNNDVANCFVLKNPSSAATASRSSISIPLHATVESDVAVPIPTEEVNGSSAEGEIKDELLEFAKDLPPPARWVCPTLDSERSQICSETGVTLSRYMMEMARYNPELEEVESIFTSLQVACKAISNLVRNAALSGNTGYANGGGSINVQGEEQKKMDIIANDIMKNAFHWTGKLNTIASEEEDAPVTVQNSDKAGGKQDGMIYDALGNPVYSGEVVLDSAGKYVAVFDPLDGSSNIDAGIPVGTIFGIFEQVSEDEDDDGCAIDYDLSTEENEKKCLQNTLQAGHNLVAAGYCLYSSATSLVFTVGNGCQGFTLDERIGEFVLSHPDMVIPNRGKIYSFNEANRWDWDEPLQKYITDIQQGHGQTKSRYSSRYVGSMVADVHRTLQYGGIFGYPADKKNLNGKLRLLYEAAPMSFLIEQAGGLALTGKNRIMDIKPHGVHQRVPCILGSRDDVLECRQYYQESKDPELIARCENRLKGSIP